MSFMMSCPYCRARHTVADEESGASFKCPRCRNFFLAEPDQVSPAPPVPPARAREEPKLALTRPTPSLSGPEPDAVEMPPPQETKATVPVAGVGHARGRPLHFHPLAMASLFLAALALIIAPWPWVRYLTIPCACLGLAGAGLLGLHFWDLSTKDRFWLMVAGTANLLVLGVALFWPHWLGLAWLGSSPIPGEDSVQAFRVSVASATRQPLEAGEWADASQEAVRQRGVQVRVLAVTQGKGKLGGPAQDKMSQQGWLQIRLSVRNVGIDRRLVYNSWSQAPAESPLAAQLTTAKPNPLFSLLLDMRPWEPGVLVPGQTAQANLAPGQALEDVLVFQAPPAEVLTLFLELPTSAWGGEGTFRFTIPRAMIKKDPSPIRILSKKTVLQPQP